MNPYGMLFNTKTNRYHPIVFRPAPLLSDETNYFRYKSKGHHTGGFDTIEEAKASINDKEYYDTGMVWDWDGIDIPAMVQWFSKV
jgi:hypothetical protein